MSTYGIDVNALTIPRRTGVEYYLASLLQAMKREPLKTGERVFLYAAKETSELRDLPQGWEWKQITFPLHQGWTHGRLSWELLMYPPDVFFSPAHELPVFHRPGQRIVTTVHDVAFARVPDVYEHHMNLRQEWAVRHSVRCSQTILVPSQSTKTDLMELYGAQEDQVVVTPLACPSGSSASPFMGRMGGVEGEGDQNAMPYFLCVSRLEKKKNQKVLVQAASEYPVTLVGKDGFGAGEIRELAKSSEKIKILGHISDSERDALYAKSTAVLVPSMYEGFGLPVLEAMQQRVPVICSDIPVFHEVAGDAAVFVDPHDPSAWKEAMHRVASDAAFREDLIKKGQVRLSAFSWEKTSQLTWDALRAA